MNQIRWSMWALLVSVPFACMGGRDGGAAEERANAARTPSELTTHTHAIDKTAGYVVHREELVQGETVPDEAEPVGSGGTHSSERLANGDAGRDDHNTQ